MKEKECLQCGKQFKPKRSTSKYCSQECQWLSMTKRDLSIHICKVCGRMFKSYNGSVFCSDDCRRKYKNNIRPTKRIKKNGKPDYSISLKKLYKRDNGRCSLCGGICNWNDYIIKDNNFIAGDYYPSIDHIKPISKGGLHEWNNIQLAHRICNTNKRDRYTLGGGSLNF